jgi:hypothetical protein
LRQPDVQLATFGRTLSETEDAIVGFEAGMADNRRPRCDCRQRQ